MNGRAVFVGALMLGDVAESGEENGLPGCDTLLNLSDFKSEALVLGNCSALRFGNRAEGRPVVDVDAWALFVSVAGVSFVGLFFDKVPEVLLMRRFLRGRLLSVF